MNLRKIPLALAMGVTLAAPAAMAQSTLNLYGKLYPYFLDEKGSGATAVGTPVSTLAGAPTGINALSGTKTLNAGNSLLGFRGKEDLGGGIRAIFQLEGQVSVDSGAGSGAGGGYMFNRNTYVGFDGRFGDLELGVNDTIFKNYGDTIRFLGLSSGTFMSTSGVLRKPGFGPSNAASFHLRRANSVQYETPAFGGVTAGVQWSTDENKTAFRDPRVWSMGVKYDQGPLYLSLAHERHYDLFGASANVPTAQRNNAATDPSTSKDVATQFAVEYRLDNKHRFEFDAIRKEYNESATVAGRFSNYRNMAYMVATESRWTEQWRTSAHYVVSRAGSCTRINAVCNTDGLEGSKFTIGAAYYLSKRTFLFGAYSKLKNGKAARYSNTENGTSPNPGEDIRHLAFGVSHNF